MNKKIKGFTHIELLAVIVILAIIALISSPIILNVIDESRRKSNINSAYGLVDAAKLYYAENSLDGNVPVDNNLLDVIKYSGERPIDGYVTLNESGEISLGVLYGDMCLMKDYTESNISTSNDIENCKYVAKPNKPVLNNGLVGITISEDGTVSKADTSNSEWYNYDEKKWANAVVLNDKNGGVTKDNILAYYVWIPKYEYKTGFLPGTGKEESIQIKFIGKNTTEASEEHIIPPGFTFGDENLSGIWVAKFEPSYLIPSKDGNSLTCESNNCEPTNNVRILPGFNTLKNISVSESFYISRSLGNSYDLEGNSHMMKNSEWATVAYLSHSKYGKNEEVSMNDIQVSGGGSEDAYVTNVAQSTTGNITGIYDMPGGAFEYMMSSHGTDENNASIGLSGFSTLPDKKYYDVMFKTNTMLGHAIGDTENWYYDGNYYGTTTIPWVIRGGSCHSGSGSGMFRFDKYDGDSNGNNTFRPVFVETK